MKTRAINLFPLLCLSISCSAKVVINEVASKGTSDFCAEHDWVELYNNGSDPVDLSEGYILHDSKGMNDENAFTFPAMTVLDPWSFLVLCTKMQVLDEESLLQVPDPMSPQFGISADDTINLVKMSEESMSNVTSSRSFAFEVVTVGPLPEIEDTFDVTYALNASTGDFSYTSSPTPGQPNVFTALLSHDERVRAHKNRLAEQDALGTVFFNMDQHGLPVENGMDEVLDLHISMNEEDYQYIMQNAFHELYRPLQSMVLKSVEGAEVARFDNPGRIRPKGQTSLYMSQCLDTETIPFQIDMDYYDPNQTLFGVSRFYLRHHMKDNSYMRDWAYNRMLARFGLPHLRSRTVRLFMNGQTKPTGLYTLMEAPDNEFVFARNFPSYNPDSFSLYKVTNLGVTCGEYTTEQINKATDRLFETSTPPYAFERGDHRKTVEVLGLLRKDQCVANYMHDVEVRDKEDVVLAWLRHDRDCAKMRMEEGLVDRDLGTSDWDNDMEAFLREHLDRSLESCTPHCSNSHLAEDVDVDNFLRTMAFYAVTLDQDSPLGNGNNYYLAQAGDGRGWKLQAYDFNFAFAAGCQEKICDERLIHWSIVRPTCQALEDNKLAGPLLTNPTLQSQYLEYVKEFTTSVYSNSSLIEEMTAHVNALRPYAESDVFSTFGIYIKDELSTTAASWNTGNFPLLPTIKARSEDVKAQLEAINDGSFPRGPIVGATDGDPWEVCADWHLLEPNSSACEQGCKYEGCHIPGWTVESYCDEESGTCYHGDRDDECWNIVDGEQYAGMKSRFDGRPTFCRFAQGIPVKASQCPLVGQATLVDIVTGGRSEERSSGSSSSFVSTWAMLIALSPCIVLAATAAGLR